MKQWIRNVLTPVIHPGPGAEAQSGGEDLYARDQSGSLKKGGGARMSRAGRGDLKHGAESVRGSDASSVAKYAPIRKAAKLNEVKARVRSSSHDSIGSRSALKTDPSRSQKAAPSEKFDAQSARISTRLYRDIIRHHRLSFLAQMYECLSSKVFPVAMLSYLPDEDCFFAKQKGHEWFFWGAQSQVDHLTERCKRYLFSTEIRGDLHEMTDAMSVKITKAAAEDRDMSFVELCNKEFSQASQAIESLKREAAAFPVNDPRYMKLWCKAAALSNVYYQSIAAFESKFSLLADYTDRKKLALMTERSWPLMSGGKGYPEPKFADRRMVDEVLRGNAKDNGSSRGGNVASSGSGSSSSAGRRFEASDSDSPILRPVRESRLHLRRNLAGLPPSGRLKSSGSSASPAPLLQQKLAARKPIRGRRGVSRSSYVHEVYPPVVDIGPSAAGLQKNGAVVNPQGARARGVAGPKSALYQSKSSDVLRR